jgi:hypothetical protein
MLEIGWSDHLMKVSLQPTNDWYAFRVGYVGSKVDSFNKHLLGKVLDEQSFEPNIETTTKQKRITTSLAKLLLDEQLSTVYSKGRQRLIVANLTGSELERREEQLKHAVTWLKAKEVSVIYFQYQWMVTTQMKQQLGLFEFTAGVLAVP